MLCSRLGMWLQVHRSTVFTKKIVIVGVTRNESIRVVETKFENACPEAFACQLCNTGHTEPYEYSYVWSDDTSRPRLSLPRD